MKHFQLYRNIIALAIVALLSGGAIVYADFIRTTVPPANGIYGYGYGYDTDTLEYGYGYGYHQSDMTPTDREEYGFPGTTGVAISITAASTSCTTATISYTSDYLARHRVAYGIASVTENATSSTGFESGPGSISLSGLTASTTYLYVLGSTDVGGNSWPAAQSSFTTPSCSSGGGGGGGYIPPVVPPTTPVTPGQILGSGMCPAHLIINDFMKSGDRDGRYSVYNKKRVREVAKLQWHINRILAVKFNQAAGPRDGIFLKLTKQGVMRLQVELNAVLKPQPLLAVDGIVGPETRKAINNSCGGLPANTVIQ